jgi:hypothetical protein
MNRFLVATFLTVVAIIAGVSCRYQNSHSAHAPQTLFIKIVRNDSMAPQLGAFLSTNLRTEVVRRGNYKLSSRLEDADVVLNVSLLNFTNGAEVYNPKDTLLASGINLRISADISLINRDGELLMGKRTIEENSSVVKENVNTSASLRDPVFSLSIGLARKISNTIENYQW